MQKFLSTPSGWRATGSGVNSVDTFAISIHALRVEGDPSSSISFSSRSEISIHALRVEGDIATYTGWLYYQYFYPRPPGGGRQQHFFLLVRLVDFYPRPPGGGRPGRYIFMDCAIRFLSTPSGWRATLGSLRLPLSVTISIHALRVEGDQGARHPYCTVHISIHALRVEGDAAAGAQIRCGADFYPRPPGGGRLRAC